jgi:hypothetical protein
MALIINLSYKLETAVFMLLKKLQCIQQEKYMKKSLLFFLLFISIKGFAADPNFDSNLEIVFIPRATVNNSSAFTDIELVLRSNLTWLILKANEESPLADDPINPKKIDPNFDLSTRIVTFPRVTVDNNVTYLKTKLLLKEDFTWKILSAKKEQSPTPEPILNLAGDYKGSTTSNVNRLLNTRLTGSLTQNGNNLTGNITITNLLGEDSGLATGQIDGKNISFSVTVRGSTISFEGIISDDNKTLSGDYTWSAFNDNGVWSITLQ